MAPRIAAHIERGLELKRQYVELVSAWQYDPKTDGFNQRQLNFLADDLFGSLDSA
jgi:hypothetical protein